MKREWFTWSNAKKAYFAVAGLAAVLVANWANAPTWVYTVASALTVGAVWLAKNEPSTTRS